ncbi:MAG: hypothetical protein GWN62_17680, partial [Aliifodinibius sp.]|nr:hypothetical protein [Fodinibius sp.]
MPQQRPQRLVIPSIPVHDFQQYLDGRRKSYVGDFDLTPQIDDIVILQQEQQTPPPPGPQFIQTTTT